QSRAQECGHRSQRQLIPQTNKLRTPLYRAHQSRVDLFIDPRLLDRLLGQQDDKMRTAFEAFFHLSAKAVAKSDLPIVVPDIDSSRQETLGEWLCQPLVLGCMGQVDPPYLSS